VRSRIRTARAVWCRSYSRSHVTSCRRPSAAARRIVVSSHQFSMVFAAHGRQRCTAGESVFIRGLPSSCVSGRLVELQQFDPCRQRPRRPADPGRRLRSPVPCLTAAADAAKTIHAELPRRARGLPGRRFAAPRDARLLSAAFGRRTANRREQPSVPNRLRRARAAANRGGPIRVHPCLSVACFFAPLHLCALRA
jgi:hypothetical protein